MNNMKLRIPTCPHGTMEKLSLNLIQALEKLELDTDTELEFSSGYRCKACNAAAGGVKNSAHTRGEAVDIICSDSSERYDIIHSAIKLNFARIGIGRGFIHLDVDYSLPQHTVWLY